MDEFYTILIAFILATALIACTIIAGDIKGTNRERMYWCEKTETLKVEFDKCMEDR